MPLFSVIICTYNRALHLDQALASIAAQTLADNAYEVVVVDNNSSDATADIVRQWIAGGRVPGLRYVMESRQGVSFARNRGAAEAAGSYLAYLDDDCKAAPDWLKVAAQLVATRHPPIFGGPYFPIYSADPPVWWRDQYRIGWHGAQACVLEAWQFLSTGNLFVNRSLFISLGGFDEALGPVGDILGVGGEDTALQVELRRRYPEMPIYYDPALVMWHLVHQDKMTLRWLIPYWFAEGRSECRLLKLYEYNTRRRFVYYDMIASALRAARDGAWSVVSRDRRQYRYWRQYLVERWSGHIRDIGKACEKLGHPFP